MAAWIIVAVVFVAVVVWYGWHSTHNELTKKINRETDPEARRELIKLQGQIDRGEGWLLNTARMHRRVL